MKEGWLKASLVWGSIIGLINLIWLYASYYLGLHTSGMGPFWGFMGAWFVINVALYLVALKAVRKSSERWGYGRGMASGTVMGLISGAVAVIAQVGYFKIVNPEWPEYIATQTGEMMAANGVPEEEVSRQVDLAREKITLPIYAVQSAITAFLLALFLSALMMIFLRRKPD